LRNVEPLMLCVCCPVT